MVVAILDFQSLCTITTLDQDFIGNIPILFYRRRFKYENI